MSGSRVEFIVLGAVFPHDVGILIASFLRVRCNWCDEKTGVLLFQESSSYDWVCIPCAVGCMDTADSKLPFEKNSSLTELSDNSSDA